MENRPPPRALYATSRSPERRTRGGEVARLAELLGFALMWWQKLVLDVALEVDDQGRPVYRVVIVSIPRQQGKTFLLFLLIMHRLLCWSADRQIITYSAQSVTDAVNVWEEKLFPMFLETPLAEAFELQPLRSPGNAGLRSVTGRLILTSTSKSAGHGQSMDLAVLDEAHAYRDSSREAAVVPAMRARPDAQLWVVSTAGDELSEYFRSRVEMGRDHVQAGRREGVAHFEWGLDADADAEDESLWWDACPAMIDGRVTVETIRAERALMTEDDWRRAALNQWREVRQSDPMVDVDVWEGLLAPGAAPSGRLVLGMAAARDRSTSAVVVSGNGVVEVIRAGSRVDWLEDSVRGLFRAHGDDIAAVLTPARGPLVTVADNLRMDGIPAMVVPVVEVADACGSLWAAIHSGAVTFRPHPAWWRSLIDVKTAQSGEGMIFKGVRFSAEIGPLIGAAVSFWAAEGHKRIGSVPQVADWDDPGFDEWLAEYQDAS